MLAMEDDFTTLAGVSHEWRGQRQREEPRNCSHFLIQCLGTSKLSRNLFTGSRNNTAAHHGATYISKMHINYSNTTTSNTHISKRLMAYSVQVLHSLNKKCCHGNIYHKAGVVLQRTMGPEIRFPWQHFVQSLKNLKYMCQYILLPSRIHRWD